ncbi:hypothetical protein [Nonomuraea typhae]|uniref:hypothetical protein n=1 Tax=Nonomuraea typhae TaxID=2603600 RepID=UPI0012FCA149|nr:hypothetical protein [Nonomuraea typhae]
MSDTMKQTPDDAPFTEESLAKLALAATARELADFAAGFVAIYPGRPYEVVEDAARCVARAQELLVRAVIAQRAAGGSWEDIGAALDITKQSAHAKFREASEEWDAAIRRPEVVDQMYGITGSLETHVFNRMPAGTARPEETAADLDAWALAHAAADGRTAPGHVDDRPVSGGMVRMDPLTELMTLTNRTAAIRDEFIGPPPHLLADVHEREAVLWDRVAAEGGTASRGARKRASEARKRATDYRAQDAHLRKIAATQSPAEHVAEHERRYPHEIYGPYRTFPDLASARDWCAHCEVWIGTPETKEGER